MRSNSTASKIQKLASKNKYIMVAILLVICAIPWKKDGLQMIQINKINAFINSPANSSRNSQRTCPYSKRAFYLLIISADGLERN